MKNLLNKLFSSDNLLAGSIASLLIWMVVTIFQTGGRMLVIIPIYLLSMFILGGIVRVLLKSLLFRKGCDDPAKASDKPEDLKNS